MAGKTLDERLREEWLAQARQLIADGYNSSVITRKMITQYGMKEPEAEALVGKLLGKKVSARTGDTLYRIWGGIVAIILGGFGCWYYLTDLDGDLLAGMWIWRSLFFFGLVGAGMSQIILAFVNHGVKDDLHDPRRFRGG